MARFGVYLPQLRMSYETILDKALAAERAGFDSVWLMDHLAAPAAPQWDTFEGWTLAAALAARTSRIRLGHLVLCNPFRHPALLAKMASTLDRISGGRLEIGIGLGSVESELAAYGFGREPAPVRAEKLEETLQILRLMFGGGPVDFAGKHFSLSGAVALPRPVQERVPIHIGGAGRRLTMPLVRRYADWWNCPGYAVARLEELLPLRGAARVSVQHPLGLAASAADREEVLATVTRRFGSWGGIVAGTPDEVAERLRREADLGVELFVFQFFDFGTPASFDLFMREVAPAL